MTRTHTKTYAAYEKPIVHLIASSKLEMNGIDDFLARHDTEMPEEWHSQADADKLGELAGRVCYMAFGKKAHRTGPAYLKHILDVKHGSILEHSVITILVEGISRTASHEWVRHRAGKAYSQLSQRYVDSEAAALVLHPACRDDKTGVVKQMLVNEFERGVSKYEEATNILAKAYLQAETLFKLAVDQGVLVSLGEWAPKIDGTETGRKSCSGAIAYYKAPGYHTEATEEGASEKWCRDALSGEADNRSLAFLKWIKKATRTARRKMARECARELLPNSVETKVVVSGNLRAWRHFFEMRGHHSADRQIRQAAVEVFRQIEKVAPSSFQGITLEETEDGLGCLVVENHKV